MGVVHCFCFGLQKYEKTSVGGVIEVLHHVSMAEEEIEHQCAALECTSTLTDFTEAMIEGRSIRLTPHLFKYYTILFYSITQAYSRKD